MALLELEKPYELMYITIERIPVKGYKDLTRFTETRTSCLPNIKILILSFLNLNVYDNRWLVSVKTIRRIRDIPWICWTALDTYCATFFYEHRFHRKTDGDNIIILKKIDNRIFPPPEYQVVVTYHLVVRPTLWYRTVSFIRSFDRVNQEGTEILVASNLMKRFSRTQCDNDVTSCGKKEKWYIRVDQIMRIIKLNKLIEFNALRG